MIANTLDVSSGQIVHVGDFGLEYEHKVEYDFSN